MKGKFLKRLFQYYKPHFTHSYITKVPSEPGSLKKSLGQQQRHKPYSVNRGVEEKEKLEKSATPGISSQHASLEQQKQYGKEMTIVLTEQESKICELLKRVATHLRE